MARINPIIPLNMSKDEIQRVFDLIPPQHKDDKFLNWVLGWCDKAVDMYLDITSYFDVATAVGAQLDIIGEYVGISRQLPFTPVTEETEGLLPGTKNVLDDELYRMIIYAQIAKNTWDGTMPHVLELWDILLPDRDLVVIDHFDMSINVVVYRTKTDLERELVENLYFVPKPAGVRVNYIFPGDMPLFGYDEDSERIAGYDKGVWAASSIMS